MEISAQDILINREETKVPAYTLPDPLRKRMLSRLLIRNNGCSSGRPSLNYLPTMCMAECRVNPGNMHV